MALLKKDYIEKINNMRNSVHKPVQATYTVFEEDGKTIFQIDTYGSPEREMPEKVSQSIQFDEDMAKFLVTELKKTFSWK